MPGKTWWKLGLVALIVVGVPWLFLKTLRDTMSEPYVIDDAVLSGWTLVLVEPAQPATVLLALQPPGRLAAGLFHQIFRRTMESMTAPGLAAMPGRASERVSGQPSHGSVPRKDPGGSAAGSARRYEVRARLLGG